MFSDGEYRALIQQSQHRPTVSEDQRFGVHFEYKDLCSRLAKLEKAPGDEKFPMLREQQKKVKKSKETLRNKSAVKINSKTTGSQGVLPHSLSPALPKASSRARLRSLSPLEDLLVASPYKQIQGKKTNAKSGRPMLRKAVKAAIGQRL